MLNCRPWQLAQTLLIIFSLGRRLAVWSWLVMKLPSRLVRGMWQVAQDTPVRVSVPLATSAFQSR